MKKYNKRNFSGIWFYVVLLAIVLLIFSVLNYRPGIKQILYSDLLNYIKSEQITEMVIEDRKVTIALKEQNPVGDSNKRIASIPSIGILYENAGEEIQKQLDSGSLKLDTPAPEEFPWWVSFLPTLLTVGIFIAFWFFFMRQAQGGGKAMSFGKSTAKMTQGSETHVTFKDVAGADEEKEELEEIVDFLRDSSKFIELGARIPKGILLVGPPGTGKTLLAKAVAGEAKVPFFSISGSDFVEMFVGVGASRVRDLFEQAKKNSPSIIFIDEIDAVGRHRGAGLGGGHDEREQTLNQLLVEMDGFGANEGIIIIAATNRPDILDPALLRPGRFDRQVVVNTPDAKGREEILKVHSRAKPLASDVDLSVLAKTTSGFTGADLENLMNEAALLAAKKGQKKINMKDIEDSVIKVIAGPEKRSKVVSDKEKKLVSYHEAGHAIIHHVLPHCDPVHEVSIIQRGRAGGYTLSLPKEDKNYVSKEDMLDNIVSLLGGRVAEKLVLDDISTGASNDIERASKIARDMVTKYGMSERLGPISFRSDNDEVFLGMSYSHSRDYSEEVAAEIDGEVRRIIEDSYKRCTDILTENMAKLHNVAGALFEKEKINGDEFVQLFHMDETTNDETEETKTIEPDSDFEPENA
ncbi:MULTISPECIES: ATP-dependent zinc metalloprotease FtsH [Congzhengia]|uniref:ATP-dependent zinc metalloprotease FtsH n=1 Tax=Congzhengia minquanensis TaxID=2763657 RepID=A0A926HUE0_9FIRM|nr:ATP-dependent zinc metalloprotease FtsH [Congzhengia minquanensis]MBC8540482.1 ATP-dependent metallopeptidase FtsH/Yme1/Tma family protein [Congzhengia minquanensis]